MTNNSQQNNDNIFLFTKYNLINFSDIYFKSMAKLLFELDADGQEYVDNITKAYVEYVYEKTKKKTSTITTTGFGRRIFEKYITKKKKKSSKNISHRYSLISKLKDCSDKNNRIITLKQFNQIFFGLYGENGHRTANAMLQTLIRTKILEMHGDKALKFNTSIPPNGVSSIEDISRIFSDMTNRLSSTCIHNMKASCNADTLLQRTLTTQEIPLNLHKQCAHELRIKMREQQKELVGILEKYEAKAELEKARAVSTNIELGFSQLIFNNKIK